MIVVLVLRLELVEIHGLARKRPETRTLGDDCFFAENAVVRHLGQESGTYLQLVGQVEFVHVERGLR